MTDTSALTTGTTHPAGTYTYRPRGTGLNWIPCFICGSLPADGKCQTDMAAFVANREDGLAICKLYTKAGLTATLDYRDFEPNWVQVKVGACTQHEANLTLLQTLVGTHDGTINAAILKTAKLGGIQPKQ